MILSQPKKQRQTRNSNAIKQRVLELIEKDVAISSILQMYNLTLAKTNKPLPIIDSEFSYTLPTLSRQYILFEMQEEPLPDIMNFVWANHFFDRFEKVLSGPSEDIRASLLHKGKYPARMNQILHLEAGGEEDEHGIGHIITVDDDFLIKVFCRQGKILEQKTGKATKKSLKIPEMSATAYQQYSRILNHFTTRKDRVMTQESVDMMLSKIKDSRIMSLQSKLTFLFSYRKFLGLLQPDEKAAIPFLANGNEEKIKIELDRLIAPFQDELEKHQLKSVFTAKESEKYMRWPRILANVNMYLEKNEKTENVWLMQDCIWLRFMMLENEGIIRRLEHGLLKWYNSDQENMALEGENWVDISTGLVTYRDYKTHRYGPYSFTLSPQTLRLLVKYLDLRSTQSIARCEGNYLANDCDIEEEPTGSFDERQVFRIRNLSKFNQRIFHDATGEFLNLNLLRKSLINYHKNQGKLLYPAEINRIAAKMGTSAKSIVRHYLKRDEDLDLVADTVIDHAESSERIMVNKKRKERMAEEGSSSSESSEEDVNMNSSPDVSTDEEDNSS